MLESAPGCVQGPRALLSHAPDELDRLELWGVRRRPNDFLPPLPEDPLHLGVSMVNFRMQRCRPWGFAKVGFFFV